MKLYHLIKEFFRYCIVGGIAFLMDFGALVGLTELVKLDHKISAVIGFCVGLAVNYILSKVFVFKQGVDNETKALLVFTLIGVGGLGITEIGMWIGVDRLGIDYRLVKIIMTAIVLIWNYIGRKVLIFNKPIEAEIK